MRERDRGGEVRFMMEHNRRKREKEAKEPEREAFHTWNVERERKESRGPRFTAKTKKRR